MALTFGLIVLCAMYFGLPYAIGSGVASSNKIFDKTYKSSSIKLKDKDVEFIKNKLVKKRFNAISAIAITVLSIAYLHYIDASYDDTFKISGIFVFLCFFFIPQWGFYQETLNLLKPMDKENQRRMNYLFEKTTLSVRDFLPVDEANNLKNIHFYIIRKTIEDAEEEAEKQEKEKTIRKMIKKE